MTKKVSIYTLGCKVNQYESEAIGEKLENLGFCIVGNDEIPDAYIINTCTVTAESDRKARQFIRRAIRENDKAFILVTGCFAETSADDIAKIEGVDFICGNSEKLIVADELQRLFNIGKKNEKPIIVNNNINSSPFEKMSIKKFDRTRAYIKIEDGCENNCTYCIIPKGRGLVRSKPLDDVLTEICHFVKSGCKEVVLTGIESASYGRDIGSSLLELLTEADKIEGDFTIRIGSIDPSIMSEKFVDGIKNLKKLAPHFHISLQSGSSNVLRNMHRKYNRQHAIKAIERVRNAIPSVRFTTDIIVGFPGESEEDYLESESFARFANFLKVHVFPYSKRKGTPASIMPNQVPEEIKKERAHRLIALEEEIRNIEFDKILKENTPHSVLFESFDNGIWTGHTRDFIEVSVKTNENLHGEIKEVKLVSHDKERFFGNLLTK